MANLRHQGVLHEGTKKTFEKEEKEDSSVRCWLGLGGIKSETKPALFSGEKEGEGL